MLSMSPTWLMLHKIDLANHVQTLCKAVWIQQKVEIDLFTLEYADWKIKKHFFEFSFLYAKMVIVQITL